MKKNVDSSVAAANTQGFDSLKPAKAVNCEKRLVGCFWPGWPICLCARKLTAKSKGQLRSFGLLPGAAPYFQYQPEAVKRCLVAKQQAMERLCIFRGRLPCGAR